MITRTVILAVAALFSVAAAADEKCDAIFLSKSAGFEHSCIRWDENKISHVDRVLKDLQDKMGVGILCTKDASLINAENLKNYRLVIFFTTSDLTQEGTDKQPPMGPNGQAELLEWIQNGGGFIGYHCASDSFHQPEGGDVTPYIKMLGGEFRAHGAQFVGTVRVVDTDHPTMANVPAEWSIKDEWYLFKNLNPNMHVLAVLDSGAEREKQEMYNIPNYPIIWCSEYGKGRVYYNAMGHREDVWTDPTFQQSVIDAARWVLGEGPADAAPNFSEIIPKEDVEKIQTPPPAKK